MTIRVHKIPQKPIVTVEGAESGFQDCTLGWSKKGKKIWGEKSGKRGKRENLVAARLKGKKDLIAPRVFTVRLNAEGFEGIGSISRGSRGKKVSKVHKVS